MPDIGTSIYSIGHLENLSSGNTLIHKIDPRIKLLTTIFYIIAVVSFDKYSVSALIPFLLYPAVLIIAGNMPFGFIFRKIIIISPFIFFIAVFNPVFDSRTIMHIGRIPVSAGWLSFFSIIFRFILTAFTSFALIAVTGFYSLCLALEKFKVPQVFAVQLLLVYRYIFILTGEALRMMRAHSLRSFQKKIKIGNFISLVSLLLIRSIGRAERIYIAMLSRGFDGTIHIRNKLKIRTADILFLFVWTGYFLINKYFNIPDILGSMITGLL